VICCEIGPVGACQAPQREGGGTPLRRALRSEAGTPGSADRPGAHPSPAPKAKAAPASLWLAANPSKRWAEVFFLAYSPFWITWALCVLVPFQLYEVGRPAGERPVPGCFPRLFTTRTHGDCIPWLVLSRRCAEVVQRALAAGRRPPPPGPPYNAPSPPNVPRPSTWMSGDTCWSAWPPRCRAFCCRRYCQTRSARAAHAVDLLRAARAPYGSCASLHVGVDYTPRSRSSKHKPHHTSTGRRRQALV
jgi:hypothetical protein